ncbi:MAG TPA: DUF6089 family protein, partial [Bacteroidales bacterium]
EVNTNTYKSRFVGTNSTAFARQAIRPLKINFARMKKSIVIVLFMLPVMVFSQQGADLGICIGGASYWGDINYITPFYSPGINLGITYRYNFNPRQALKIEANYMRLSANDASFDDIYQKSRNNSFALPLYDGAIQYEFNFMPIKFIAQKYYLSPFVSSGIAGAFVMSQSNLKTINFVFPFAFGVRTSIGKNWSLGVQWNFRKLFNDNLDNTENLVDKKNVNLHTFVNNNDWYNFANIFVTYKIFNSIEECPAYKKEF